jgi:hypothetical protein
MDHTEELAHAHAGDPPYFPAAEWQEFHKEDVHAGKAIIFEMSAIFTIGLCLYAVIAFITAP